MRFRKLRIAWSVGWGVLAVLLCVLWVRSNLVHDAVSHIVTGTEGYGLASDRGVLTVLKIDVPRDAMDRFYQKSRWFVLHNKIDPGFPPIQSRWGVVKKQTPYLATGVEFPHWFLILFSAAFAVIPWLSYFPRRFGVRTLLIAMTLIAVGLGMIVWMSRAV